MVIQLGLAGHHISIIKLQFISYKSNMSHENQMNRTFLPKQIIRKSSLNNSNSLLAAHQFEKTSGNQYIQFEPFEVKFNGYQLSKPLTATVKIINKAPIPQRVHILPPTEPNFAIKVNKKGPIAAGMSQNILITFISDVYKYQYDVIKINTETQNFVVPVYAYPSIPKVREIFPKLIDYGSIEVNTSQSNIYPINNPVPIDFQYEFQYISESQAFIITPIKGIIAANSTENIQITFIPSDKVTFNAQVLLKIKQFDFEPIVIKLMGSGKDKKQQTLRSTKRIKSSKLNPLKTIQPEKQISEIIEKEPNNDSIIRNQNNETLGLASNKRSFIRSKASFPKLMKRNVQTHKNLSVVTMEDKFQTNAKKQNEKQYLGRYSRVSELDKEKQVKFTQYLGDHPMTEEQIAYEKAVMEEYHNTRLRNLQNLCVNRNQNQQTNTAEVEYAKYVPKEFKWDANRNDQLKLRKQKLQAFMNAGSKIIEKYRLEKRLKKIREFLEDCRTREDVAKKVQQDYQKSLDSSNNGQGKINGRLHFDMFMLQPQGFDMNFQEEGQSIEKVFDTEGTPDFDDNMPINEIKPHETETMNYQNFTFPPEFVNLAKQIPQTRRSAEEQLPLRSATLPSTDKVTPTYLYNLQLKMPTHYFISNNSDNNRFKAYNPDDQKTGEYLCSSQLQQIEDQFEGWSTGDYQVLKAKFQRNLGCQFSGISIFKSPDSNDVGFLGELGGSLPKQIGMNELERDDVIEEEDSDEEKLDEIVGEKGEQYLSQIEQGINKIKQHRQSHEFQSFQNQLYSTIQKNLMESKMIPICHSIDKIESINKQTENSCHRLLI